MKQGETSHPLQIPLPCKFFSRLCLLPVRARDVYQKNTTQIIITICFFDKFRFQNFKLTWEVLPDPQGGETGQVEDSHLRSWPLQLGGIDPPGQID